MVHIVTFVFNVHILYVTYWHNLHTKFDEVFLHYMYLFTCKPHFLSGNLENTANKVMSLLVLLVT
jgi:hypothetical protein